MEYGFWFYGFGWGGRGGGGGLNVRRLFTVVLCPLIVIFISNIIRGFYT